MKYRIVKNVYQHLIENEDGLGSITNIGGLGPQKTVVWEKEFKNEIDADYFPPRRIDISGYLGFVSIDFELQVFDQKQQEWVFVDFLKEKFDD
jgi:hypothetical protein